MARTITEGGDTTCRARAIPVGGGESQTEACLVARRISSRIASRRIDWWP